MISTSSVPLIEAIPWTRSKTKTSQCWLVCDSVETDGRFLLHTMASHTLFSQKRVYWLACGSWTCQLVAAAMKKMGCEAAASYLRESTSSPLHIRSVAVEMSKRLEEVDSELDSELYMKEIYHSIRSWIQSDSSLLVVDDASALAALLGERLTYCFLLTLRALVKQTNSCNILIRCSQDYEMDILKEQETSSVRAGASRNVDWIAAGGANDAPIHIPWERSLAELANGIVNVEPLASGYSREAHGRLVFVSQPTNDDEMNSLTPLVVNYCCHDTSVSAIRLRGPER